MRPLPSRQLDRRIKRVWRLSATIGVVLWFLVAVVPVFATVAIVSVAGVFEEEGTLVSFMTLAALFVALVLAFIIFVLIVPAVRYRQWRFEVLDEEIDIHKGIFWRKRIIIPLIRVQNVDTHQGPIMRAFGLASFTVSTAAGEHVIPGLQMEEADALRDHVAVLARIAQEDV